MSFVPFENICIVTHFKPDEVIAIIINEIEPEKTFSFKGLFSRSKYFFKGYTSTSFFEIERIVQYRNSFAPVIKATIQDMATETHIYIKMRMNVPITIFLIGWLGFTAAAGIYLIIEQLTTGNFNLSPLKPLSMFAFGYTLTTLGFIYESDYAKEKLLRILKGTIKQ